MDEQLALLITSVAVNFLLVVKEIFAHIKKSRCCGAEIEMDNNKELPPVPTV